MAYNDAFHLIGIMLACSMVFVLMVKPIPGEPVNKT
jgi:DHA2 family multidrug resistance protein